MPKQRTPRFDHHDPAQAGRDRLAGAAAWRWLDLRLARPCAGNISSDTRAGTSGRSGEAAPNAQCVL
jgi:hypothetical protein